MPRTEHRFHLPIELELFEVRAGSEHYFVAAKEFFEGLEAVWHKYGAKTDDDLPKPFSFDRVKPHDQIYIAEKIQKPKKEKRNG